MRGVPAIAFAAALGCGEEAAGPAVHVVLLLEDPEVVARAAEIDEVAIAIDVHAGGEIVERIEKDLPVPASAFVDGAADFDFPYEDRTGVFDLYATAGVQDVGIARGERFEIPLEPGEVRLPLSPWTSLWTSPEAIDPDEGPNGAGPRVVVDASGLVTVVWASGTEVWTNGGAFGEGWSGAAAIAGGDGAASGVRLAADGGGNTYLAWQQGSAGIQDALALRRPAGDPWPDAPLEIDYNDDEGAFDPDVAANAGGTAVASFAQTWFEKPESSDRASVWVAFYEEPVFENAEPLDRQRAGSIVDTAVAVAADDRAYLLWQEQDAGIWWDHYANGEDPESRAEPIERLDPDDSGATLPRIAADARGEVFAAWVGDGRVHVSRMSDLAWEDTDLPDTTDGQVGDLEIVVDGRGGAAVVFVKDGDVRGATWDGGWSEIERLEPTDGVTAEPDVALASDGSGSVTALFVQANDGRNTLWAVELDDDGWGAPAALPAADEITNPHLAIGPAGAVAVWEQGVGAGTRIHASLRGL